jgi:hypothetical protein
MTQTGNPPATQREQEMTSDSDVMDRVHKLEVAQATQAAAATGAQATQAAAQAGAMATNAAGMAGMGAAVVSGAAGFIIGVFMGLAIAGSRA